VVELPTIALAPPASWKPLDEAIRQLESYDWLVFTSANGVDGFFARLRRHRRHAKTLRGFRLAAIGPATARALRARGLRPNVVPDEFRAEGLLAALRGVRWGGQRVLLARAAKAREVLPRELRRRGARVKVVPVYQTILPKQSRERARKIFTRKAKPEAVTFTSSSTVKNFFALKGRAWARRALQGVAVATIGPVTSQTARALGLRVSVEANPYTVPALVRALERYFRQQPSLP
jgi:uroporphyrinogen III methyltransferase/synthase